MEEIHLKAVVSHEKPDIKIHVDETERSKASLRSGTEKENIQQNYVAHRNVAEGMMDLALLTANANQLRFVIAFNSRSSTFYISLILIILSLVLQVAVGIALIFKRRNGKKCQTMRTNQFVISGVFVITFINILIAAFTSADA